MSIKEQGENEKNKLTFYSSAKEQTSLHFSECLNFKKNLSTIKYPCIILIRNNFWNDYSYNTHFEAFHFSDDEHITSLGTVLIIQAHQKSLNTELPEEFTELPKETYFSRGTLNFYEQLRKLNIKDIVLSALNDIHYHSYSKEYILSIDMSLYKPYENSLFRSDFCDLDVSSDYAKNSIDMLDKITNCVHTLSQIGELNNQKVIRRLLYGSVITTLESYLGDAFKYQVISNRKNFLSFLEKNEFKQEKTKYELIELYSQGSSKVSDFVENRVKEIMDNIIFHKVNLVISLYKGIIKIDLTPELIQFVEPIGKRHDIFHRNGKNRAGIEFDISESEIFSLITQVKKIISDTERRISGKSQS